MPSLKKLIALTLALTAAFCFAGCAHTVENNSNNANNGDEPSGGAARFFEAVLITEIPVSKGTAKGNSGEDCEDLPSGIISPPASARAPEPTSKPTASPTAEPTQKPTLAAEPMKEFNYVPGYTNVKYVNFRNAPSLEADILRICRYGTNVFITGRTSEWFRVVIGEKTGYIAKPYITLGYLVTPPPTPRPMYTVKPGRFSDYEISLVAALLHKEGPGSTKRGYRAIASVVLNRVLNESRWFPNDVAGVLFQKGQFGYSREELESVAPNPVALKAARYVFSSHGSVLPKKVLFYRAERLGTVWKDYMGYYATIEDNCYFYGKFYY